MCVENRLRTCKWLNYSLFLSPFPPPYSNTAVIIFLSLALGCLRDNRLMKPELKKFDDLVFCIFFLFSFCCHFDNFHRNVRDA